MCSITQETASFSSSYRHMRTPGICHWSSDRFNSSQWSFEVAVQLINPNIYTDQCEPTITYHYITLLVVIQLYIPRYWQLDSNYCGTRCRQLRLKFRLSPLLSHLYWLGKLQSDISLFALTWTDSYSPNQRWESTHMLHIYPLGFYSLRRHRLIRIGIPIMNLRRSSDRLMFIMKIPIPARRRLLSE